jgi:hypothetical protein
MGGLHQFTPYVLGPSGVPEVTDSVGASANPELAVLSALAHGRDANFVRAIEIALAARNAIANLDAERASIYVDLITNALGEAARQALKNTDMWKYEYQTEFARHHFARGVAEGEARGIAEGEARGIAEGETRGRAALITRQLAGRFGHVEAQVKERIEQASIAELDAIGDRLLTARTLQEALGGK